MAKAVGLGSSDSKSTALPGDAGVRTGLCTARTAGEEDLLISKCCSAAIIGSFNAPVITATQQIPVATANLKNAKI